MLTLLSVPTHKHSSPLIQVFLAPFSTLQFSACGSHKYFARFLPKLPIWSYYKWYCFSRFSLQLSTANLQKYDWFFDRFPCIHSETLLSSLITSKNWRFLGISNTETISFMMNCISFIAIYIPFIFLALWHWLGFLEQCWIRVVWVYILALLLIFKQKHSIFRH